MEDVMHTDIETLKAKAKTEAGLTPTESRKLALLEFQARMQAQEKSKPCLNGLLLPEGSSPAIWT
jgi:hypothetical protein